MGKASWTRGDGPLALLADGFRGELACLSHPPSSARHHMILMGQLSGWLNLPGLATEHKRVRCLGLSAEPGPYVVRARREQRELRRVRHRMPLAGSDRGRRARRRRARQARLCRARELRRLRRVGPHARGRGRVVLLCRLPRGHAASALSGRGTFRSTACSRPWPRPRCLSPKPFQIHTGGPKAGDPPPPRRRHEEAEGAGGPI